MTSYALFPANCQHALAFYAIRSFHAVPLFLIFQVLIDILFVAIDVAIQGPGADGKYPFGSVLVAEVYKAKKNDKGEILAFSLALIAVLERITCFRWTICKIKFLFIGPGHRIFANFSLL